MDSNYYTVLGWVVTIATGGAAWYYYTGKDGRQREFRGRSTRSNLPRVAEVAAPASESSRRKKQQDRPRPAKRRDSEAQNTSTPQPIYNEREEKEDMSWAHQLAQKKQGTTLAPPARAAQLTKTVKQNSANNRAAELSAESSTSDADDDLSPAVSPALNGGQPSGRNVSDMLEPAGPGPSVLKLTEPTNPKQTKQKQQPKAVVQQETKKQRQNRQKVEEKKAQREADEKERRALMEKQRRTARESRGEAAKNGLGISAAPASNAWKATNNIAPAPVTNGQLLDTFAHDDTTTTGSTAPTSVSASPVQPIANDKWWNGSMPSEEEQHRMLLAQDEESAWVTVSGKGKKGNRQANGGAVQPIEAA